jgi:hypothetical protein
MRMWKRDPGSVSVDWAIFFYLRSTLHHVDTVLFLQCRDHSTGSDCVRLVAPSPDLIGL